MKSINEKSTIRNPQSAIRVLIVEDSMLSAQMIKRVLETDPDIEIVGIAHDGYEAKALNRKLSPDLILMDIHMPNMNGVEATRIIMRHNPVPILVVTATIQTNMTEIFDALEAGAMEAIHTPTVRKFSDIKNLDIRELQFVGRELLRKVHSISTLGTFVCDKAARIKKEKYGVASLTHVGKRVTEPIKGRPADTVIAIGGSTGAPIALRQLLKQLRKDFPAAVLIAQHMEESFTRGLAEWLDSYSELKVIEARNNDMIVPGSVYVAEGGKNMKVSDEGKIIITGMPSQEMYKPSVNVLFKSIAEVYGKNAIGILLSGMGSDGAEGLKTMRDFGALTIVQDEDSSVVYGMPRAGVELNAVDKVLSLNGIMVEVMNYIKKKCDKQ